jgi:hypothetical protein
VGSHLYLFIRSELAVTHELLDRVAVYGESVQTMILEASVVSTVLDVSGFLGIPVLNRLRAMALSSKTPLFFVPLCETTFSQTLIITYLPRSMWA